MSNHKGLLFITEDRSRLTQQTFTALINRLQLRLNLSTKNYNTYSLQLEAATSAAEARIPDTYINMIGRWRSDTYQITYLSNWSPAFEYLKCSLAYLYHLSWLCLNYEFVSFCTLWQDNYLSRKVKVGGFTGPLPLPYFGEGQAVLPQNILSFPSILSYKLFHYCFATKQV